PPEPPRHRADLRGRRGRGRPAVLRPGAHPRAGRGRVRPPARPRPGGPPRPIFRTLSSEARLNVSPLERRSVSPVAAPLTIGPTVEPVSESPTARGFGLAPA